MIRLKSLVSSILLGAMFSLPCCLLGQSPTDKAERSVARPTTDTPPGGCVTAECHPKIKAAAVLHAPVATDDCGSCHQISDVAKHTFTNTREKADLCTYCHEFDVKDMPVVHKPVTEGECLGCHNPHGGATKAFVLENTTRELCGRCHAETMQDKSFLHGPVAQGACDSCHAPHASRFKNLLDAVGSDMCLTCHKEMEPALSTAKFQHEALKEGCEKCHDAHGSNLPMSMPQDMTALCYSCHPGMQEKIANSTVKHTAVSRDRTCINCHSPHASNVEKLQKDVTASTCMTCHDKAIKAEDGHMVAAVPEVVDPKLAKHGEIKDGNCSGCHDVHGGVRANLLTKPYAKGFLQQFSPSNFALCFPCHDVQLVETQNTTTATGFRNGEQNLHYVHANFGNRYKNCRTCHASHAAQNDRLIRETFTFGKRELPVKFTKNQTGGTCAPGCHAGWAYDRVKTVPVPSTQAATGPASAPAIAAIPRAQYQEAREVSWTTRDINGNEVNVPSGLGGPTALILVSAEEKGSDAIVQKLSQSKDFPADASYVVIVGGKTAAQQAMAIAAKAGQWPVVVDEGNAAGRALEAHGWPLAIVLDSTGLEVARMTGSGELLATKLRAYLQLASGKIDRSQLNAELKPGTLTEAGSATRATRDLRAARLLIQQGKAKEAIAYLDGIKPATPESEVVRAKALAMLNQPEQAIQIVSRLKPGSVSADEIELVKARAWVTMESWYQARPLLEQFVARRPGVAEAHMLLGRIYEHDQNWPKATEQYKAASEAKQ